MAHQSTDSGFGQRVRAALAVTVAVFALSLSYWGVLVRQESQASATNTVINFDDKTGQISGTAYPNVIFMSNNQSSAAILPINNPSCQGFTYPSGAGALYVSPNPGGNSPMDISFTDNQITDNFYFVVTHWTLAGTITAEAFDASGAIVDTKTVPAVANACVNDPVYFPSTKGIAHVRIKGDPTGDGSWGIDNFSYSDLRSPITNFGFSVTPLTGNAPLTVSVTYTGQGSPTPPLNWDFGDGQVVENGPTTLTHTYQTVGTYPIKLTSGTLIAQNTVVVSAAIPLPTPLSFTVTPMSGIAPLTVTGSSPTSPIDITRLWNWGDSSTPIQQVHSIGGTTTNWQDLSHIYTTPGTYIITVTQVENAGTASPITQTAQKTIVVAANTTNDATLTTSKSVYDVGEQVQFTLTNVGSNTLTLANTAPFNITSGTTTIFSPIGGQVITQLIPSKNQSWTWDQKNTTSTQVAEGVYSVTVSYTNGTEAKTKSATFTIAKQATSPTFTYKIDPTSGTAPLTVKATVTGTGSDATAPLWDFGDGTTATGVSASHTYAAAGTYTVTIRIGSQVGTQQVIVSKAIVNASPAPIKLAQTGTSLSIVLLISLIISGVLSYLIIRRPFHSNK
jgi:PKD repeat protein